MWTGNGVVMEGDDVMRLSTGRGDLDVALRSAAAAERWSLVVAVVVTLLVVWALPFEPDRVTVIVDNPTGHELTITATAPDDGSVSFVTIVGPRTTKSVPDVVDRGPRWILHVRIPGGPAGSLDVARADLVNGTLVIPATIVPSPVGAES